MLSFSNAILIQIIIVLLPVSPTNKLHTVWWSASIQAETLKLSRNFRLNSSVVYHKICKYEGVPMP